MQNIILGIVGVVIVASGAWFVFGGTSFESNLEGGGEEMLAGEETSTGTDEAQEDVEAERAVVSPGTYAVDVIASEFRWAGQKPFIDGYINSGTIDLTEGAITVVSGSEASGSFTLDMNTVEVGLTAAKPGSEGVLEEHLKGKQFFSVATYPTATFMITSVAPMQTADAPFRYEVAGDLTLRGVTQEIIFPADIYQTADGILHADAETEIDRTSFGITLGSGNFFENLGDNLIADEVALAFALVAVREE
jgi:polyisoprenoid-binding protein YceI